MPEKVGKATIKLGSSPSVYAFAAVGSKKEEEGPLGKYFDIIQQDSFFGQSSWEKAESQMQKQAVSKALEKGSLAPGDIDFIFAGDLLNQCTGSTYGLRELEIPFIGLFGACSTMAESLGLASLFVDCGAAARCAAVTSSHFCSAERQFRYPLEYASQRAPTSQWTATASGSVIVAKDILPPYVRSVTFGTIEDLQIKDANNMGAAMAPAAASTLIQFFEDTGTNQENYDLILTGDLGFVGSRLFRELTAKKGYPGVAEKHGDCGLMLYDRENQAEIYAGGSGCGCSASVLCSYILPAMREGRLQRVLFMATGALMSPTVVQQGESIPSIAHLIYLSAQPWQEKGEGSSWNG